MNHQTLKILVTAVAGNVGRSMVHYLNRFSFTIVAVDHNPEFLAAPKTSKRYIIPKASDENYISSMNAIIQKEKIDLVIFQSDAEIRKVSASPEKIKALVWLPSHKTVIQMQDKYGCNKIWEKKRIPIPHSVIVFKKNQVKGNVWIRPLHYIGGGGRMATYAKTKREAIAWIEKYRGWGKFTMSEYLPGRMFGFDSLWRRGELWGWSLKERVRYLFEGGGHDSNVVKISHDKRAIEIAIKAIRAVDSSPDGVFSVDMRESIKGIPCVTEINPGRFLTTSLLIFAEANFDLPLDYIDFILGRHVKKRPPLQGEKYLFFVTGLTRLVGKEDLKIENMRSYYYSSE